MIKIIVKDIGNFIELFPWVVVSLIIIQLVGFLILNVEIYFEKSESGVNLKEPNLSNVKRFVKRNKIDELNYTDGNFTCLNFTNQFIKEFAEFGFSSCRADIFFEGKNIGHSIATVRTTDNSIIFVDPQTDEIFVNLNVGDSWNGNDTQTIQSINSCFEDRYLLHN